MNEQDELRDAILECDQHLLVTGGPGAGKTTVALQKAIRCVDSGHLQAGQKILFLSFARATVARIVEAAKDQLSEHAMKLIDIDTYHGFAWRIIRSHSYLINGHRPKLLPPADIAALFADLPAELHDAELERLWEEQGLIGFDLFPIEAQRILSLCRRIASVYSSRYPIIIIDEFQDTSSQQWSMIKALGVSSQMIALADPDQRIYDFAGADPKRIGEFVDAFEPLIVDLANQNHRSDGTDITQYGNDLLSGANRGKVYNQVLVKLYVPGKGRASPEFALKLQVIGGMKRLIKTGNPWSLAILVPTQNTMLSIAKYLSSDEDGLPIISAQVHVDQEGPCLAAAVIAGLLEGGTPQEVFERLLSQLRSHVRGRKGIKSSPSQADLGFALSVSDPSQLGTIRRKDQRSTVEACARIANARQATVLSGDPERDWKLMVDLLRVENDSRVARVADDARYIRLLRRGSVLRAQLNELWRLYGEYRDARTAVETALAQLHFARNGEEVRGIHLMTLHKSKGKEYDEVILFEGAFQGRYVFGPTETDVARARLVLRVGVTRAKSLSTILTPKGRACPLL